MDLNELLYRHQLAVMNAPANSTLRKSHQDLARHYAGRIRAFRQVRGLAAYRMRPKVDRRALDACTYN